MKFNHRHTSSRFNKSAASLEVALDEHMKHASLITVTEVAEPPRSATLAEQGWGVSQAAGGKAADCAVLYDNSQFKLVHERFPKLGDETYINKRGFETRPIHAAIAVLQQKDSGKILVVATAHLPSGVRTANGFKKKASQYKAYVPNVRALKAEVQKTVKDMRKKGIKVTGQLIVCDWNIDVKRGWTRAFIKANFPAYTINWKKPYPAVGTFGSAIIDIALLKGIKVEGRPSVLPQDASSDHKPFSQTLRFV